MTLLQLSSFLYNHHKLLGATSILIGGVIYLTSWHSYYRYQCEALKTEIKLKELITKAEINQSKAAIMQKELESRAEIKQKELESKLYTTEKLLELSRAAEYKRFGKEMQKKSLMLMLFLQPPDTSSTPPLATSPAAGSSFLVEKMKLKT